MNAKSISSIKYEKPYWNWLKDRYMTDDEISEVKRNYLKNDRLKKLKSL
ncbi:hypothetical protein M0Q50_07855 [bacterium]|jgi:hypothetical protein|nr:hypothetical protein [bacterium]